ncbi:aminotransferase class III-fold pyridoxal phosphate-dependent enzyme [Roseobacter sp. HKCCD7870]|uniref:aminotransferase class III-fold pyridoxal phosphate-dependent enzyme n=1 Tax=Roseobacter sp. HKCCD7870 TaxID=3120343 RepID=UPI0030EF4EAB
MKRSFDNSGALYTRALNTIPLASQTFSKAAMATVEGAAPLFLERGDGARVWDVDGNEYIDYVLGLLPVVLGYRDPDVDAAIRSQLERGISFSLATDLEPELAERLVEIIPCAEMVRFGKNGSDATSAAIRLARAYTGRDRIAVAGYHGWHDWYIGTTARHLGVPQTVRDLSSKFAFNDANTLEHLLKADPQGFAAVILEPMALEAPEPGFLEAVRTLCDRYEVILVFDEIVTGFRIHLGGAQAEFGVTPDLAAFGKAMGNGMPISAIVGQREIMRHMEHIFFSGTFGGEALSLAAAIATIDKLRVAQAPKVINKLGAYLKEEIGKKILERSLTEELSVGGGDWWPAVVATGQGRSDPVTVTSLLKQELIAWGVLSGATLNLSLAHANESVVGETLIAYDRALDGLAEALRRNNPASCLRGKPLRPVFQVRNASAG